MAGIDDNMVADAISPNDEKQEDSTEEVEDLDIDDSINVEEYDMLDAKLDDLNIVLDIIEQKNDRIHKEFMELLHSNKQIRAELQQQNNEQAPDTHMTDAEEKPSGQ